MTKLADFEKRIIALQQRAEERFWTAREITPLDKSFQTQEGGRTLLGRVQSNDHGTFQFSVSAMNGINPPCLQDLSCSLAVKRQAGEGGSRVTMFMRRRQDDTFLSEPRGKENGDNLVYKPNRPAPFFRVAAPTAEIEMRALHSPHTNEETQSQGGLTGEEVPLTLLGEATAAHILTGLEAAADILF